MTFLAELRRRNVFRVAGLYLVGAWLVVQVADTLLPVFDAPTWVMKVVVGLLAAGFIPALVASWAFDLTPDGLQRDRGEGPAPGGVRTAQRLDIAVIVLLLAVGALAIWRPSLRADGEAPAGSAATMERIRDKSIAVLPFADFSQGGDQAWFADGLTEEILNSLARTPDLLVSARTSSFKYKGSTLAIPQIAAELGVAHVLEGSVRSGAGKVRVSAQLIRAADGFHLWSQTFDRDAADVIRIQEDLARQIATAMQTTMDPAALADMATVGTRSVEAYQAYLQGVALEAEWRRESAMLAHEQFERARAIDPGFGAAHARAAEFWLSQLDLTSVYAGAVDLDPQALRRRFEERSDLAIRHAASEGTRLEYRARRAAYALRLREAVTLYRSLAAERPLDHPAWGQLIEVALMASDRATAAEALEKTWPQALRSRVAAGWNLNNAHRAYDPRRAADEAVQILQRWPDEPSTLFQTHRALLWAGRVDEAREILARWLPDAAGGESMRMIADARQACADGNRAPAEAALARLPETSIGPRWLMLDLLGRRQELEAMLQSLDRDGRADALSSFLVYRQFDPAPYPSLMKVLERERVDRPPPDPIPFACPPAKAGA